MKANYFRNHTLTIAAILSLFCAAPFLFAQTQEKEQSKDDTYNRGYVASKEQIPEKKKGTVIFKDFSFGGNSSSVISLQEERDLSELQKEARLYRSQGLDYQNSGNLDAAMAMYQKAIILDPSYAVAYNDLGVVYEAKGFGDRAEESYLKAIKINPNYLSAYTNLALFYENKRDLNNAAVYWHKRVQLEDPANTWTQKAQQRLKDINLVLSQNPDQQQREDDISGLAKDTEAKKDALKKDNSILAKDYLEKAKVKFDNGDDVNALKIAIDAQQLDSSNSDIQNFIDKVQARVLSQ